MAKGQKPPADSANPQDFPQVPPRDLYPTSDIRFVLVEVGKLSAQVERLIGDVNSQSSTLGEIQHKVSFIKGAVWVGGALIAIFGTVMGFILSAKWDAVLEAIKAATK